MKRLLPCRVAQAAVILDDPLLGLRLASMNHQRSPFCVACWSANPPPKRSLSPVPTFYGRYPSRQSERRPNESHVAAEDRAYAPWCGPVWAHQVNPTHSGTRNPGLASPRAAIRASQTRRALTPPRPGSGW
ncbi:hypothetical protein V8C34DRAFT_283736 [Trichoderma compactum]